MMDKLAQSYFEKFIVRVEILSEFQKRGAHSDVVQEGQEALELFIKGLLRTIGIEPTHSHDPGKELLLVKTKVPSPFKEMVDDLVYWSKKLRKERELAFHGAADFVPTLEYSKKESDEVIQFEAKISKLLKIWLRDSKS